MDIVMNAKINNSIKYFNCVEELSNDTKLLTGVIKIMNLFGADYIGSIDFNTKDEPSFAKDTVIVRCIMMLELSPSLMMEVFYWRSDGVVGCSIKHFSLEESQLSSQSYITRVVKLNLFKIMCEITGTRPNPWGILRGVRPTKIVHRLLDSSLSKKAIIDKMVNDYALHSDKAELVTNIALYQRKILGPNSLRKVSIYIGVPFCPTRCLYCSFPAYPIPTDRSEITLFLSTIEQDIQAVVKLIARYCLTVQSIYIGGGTPTSLSDNDFKDFLSKVKHYLVDRTTEEFTVEAGRPDSITPSKIQSMVDMGVTRVSINPQTMQQKTLNRIGRLHTVEDIIECYGKMRDAKIHFINMDVIVGLPGETEYDVENTMQQICDLKPDNLTVHTLALKKGSILKENRQNYLLSDDYRAAKMIGIARKYALGMDMQPYYLYRQKAMLGNLENVGYARPGTECLYNIQIMEERQTIIGIGPAAGTKAVNVKNWRLESCYNAKDLRCYVENLETYINNRQRLMAKLFQDFKEG